MSTTRPAPEGPASRAATVPVVAIDGPAGSGKSTAARGLARRLGWRHLDTGALYRAVALALLRQGILIDRDGRIDGDDAAIDAAAGTVDVALTAAGDVLVDGVRVDDELRTDAVGRAASVVAARAAVRARLLPVQRGFPAAGPVVCEGRDMGTVVFPDARHKFWLDADPAVRAARRHAEFEARGEHRDLAAVRDELESRDRRDSGRAHAPLARASDAEVVDTSGLDAAAVVDELARRVAAAEPAHEEGHA